MCVVCDVLESISLLALSLRPHRVADSNTGCVCAGVWSPELKHRSVDLENISRKAENKQPTADLPPVWTPSSSPTPERKSYKPIRFESPTLSRKKINVDVNTKVRFLKLIQTVQLFFLILNAKKELNWILKSFLYIDFRHACDSTDF